jgi:hypothetical protein
LLKKHIDEITHPTATTTQDARRHSFIVATAKAFQRKATTWLKVDVEDDERKPGEPTKEHVERVQSLIKKYNSR